MVMTLTREFIGTSLDYDLICPGFELLKEKILSN